MAEPWQEYSSAPPSAEPWNDFVAPDNARQGGILQTVPQAVEMLGSEQGRAALWRGVTQFPADFVKGTLDFFKTPGKAASEGVTPEEEVEFGLNAALGTVGGRTIPRGTVEAVAPVVKSFNDGVMAPAAQRIVDAASERAVTPVQGSDVPAAVPRADLAATGEAHIDAVLNSAVTKQVIDHPIVNRDYDVPYTAGGSVPLENPEVFIDRHFPRSFTIDGVTFDPADPFIVHENVEQHVMDLLMKGGMDSGTAYKVAHFEFAEKAEGAWYRAHDIDQDKAEAAYAPYMAQIQREAAPNVPSALYKRPYPHDEPSAAQNEAIAEPRPTPDEIARAKAIVADAQAKGELAAGGAAETAPSPLQQARELGVIGEQRVDPVEQSPARVVARTIAAARTDDKITMTPAGEPIDAYEQRFKDWVAKIKTSDDVKDVIEQAAEQNDHFSPARGPNGQVSPAHAAAVAEAAGLDPAAVDRGGLSSKFNTDAKVRAVEQALLQVTDNFRSAADAYRLDKTEQSKAAMLEAGIRRDLVLEYTLGLRSEWGRTGQALQDILDVAKREQAVTDLLKSKGRTDVDLEQIANGMQGLSRAQAARAMTGFRGKPPHWLFWMWQQGLISGLVTHAGYAAVNTGTTLFERVLSPSFAAIFNKLAGGPQEAFIGEAPAALWGGIMAVPDAMRSAGQAFTSNMRVPLASEMELAAHGLEGKAPTPYPTAGPDWGIVRDIFGDKTVGAAETILGVPGRGANLMHTFFKVLNEGMIAKSIAYRTAAKEGLNPLSQAFWDRVKYHIDNPTEAALQERIESAYSGAFMQKLGDKSGAWARWARDNPFFRWVFPFQHIPLNIIRTGIEYSPLAVLGPEMRAALLGQKGAHAQYLAMAKMTVGSTVMGYFMYRGMMGDVTGDYPIDPKERRDWQAQGKIPNAIRAGDEWLSLDRFGPPGIIAKMGAELANIVTHLRNDMAKGDEEAVLKAVWGMAHGAANILGAEAGYQSVRNIIQAIEDPQHAARYIGYQAASFTPFSSLLGQTASFDDPYMREAKGLVANLKYRIPGLRESLPVKRDALYGEAVPNPGFHTLFRASPSRLDAVKAELERLDIHPAPPRAVIGGVKLTAEQFDRYEATAGPLVKQGLNALIGQSGWRSLPGPQQQALARGVIAHMRAQARAAVQLDDPGLIAAGVARRKAQLGMVP